MTSVRANPADTANLTPSQYAPAGETKFAMSLQETLLDFTGISWKEFIALLLVSPDWPINLTNCEWSGTSLMHGFRRSWVHLGQFLHGPHARALSTWSFEGKKWELVRLLILRRVLACLNKSSHVSEIVSIKDLEILFLHNWVDHILIEKLYSC